MARHGAADRAYLHGEGRVRLKTALEAGRAGAGKAALLKHGGETVGADPLQENASADAQGHGGKRVIELRPECQRPACGSQEEEGVVR